MDEKVYIVELKEAIEQKNGWGVISEWSTQDFQHLSDAILEVTKVNLSVTTLKRVLGKINYNAQPRISTLDALAKFLDYKDWRNFKHDIDTQNLPEKKQSNTSSPKQSFYAPYLRVIAGITLIVLVGSIIALTSSKKPEKANDKLLKYVSNVHFNITKVSKGLPNTVIFDYDISKLKANKVQIQQSWDKTKRIDIEKGQQQASCVYYYPGYYRAKLVADEQILQEKDLLIESDGWIAAIDHLKSEPEYILENDLIQKDQLKVSEKIEQAISELQNAPTLNYFYYKEFKNLPGTDFNFETGFRHTLKNGKFICQGITITIVGIHGVLNIPFSIPGCVGKLYMYLNGDKFSGKSQDFSSFGCDFSKMQHLKVTNQQNQLKIYLNNKLVWQHQLKNNLGHIAGVRYRFVGSGEVDYVKYSKLDGKVIFLEGF